MRIPRLFTDQALETSQTATLDPDASKYLTRVLRMHAGDRVALFNGDGSDYQAVINSVGRSASVEIVSKRSNESESSLKITLVQSLAKGAKLDLVIQKATELGTHRITPISNERSVLRIDNDRLKRKMDHWRNVAISACAQCNRSVIPMIDVPGSFDDWLSAAAFQNAFLLHPHANDSFATVSIDAPNCTILVGPEGGFSDEEVARATSQGITPVRCGPRILRTETAGFAAISILQARFGDLR